MNKQNIKTIVVLLVGFAILFGVVYCFSLKEKKVKEKSEFVNLTQLEDESLFLSLSETINELFIAINDGESDKIIKYLVPNYIKENKIDKNNVLEYFNKYNGTSFKASTIDVISNNDNYAFLVEGYVINNIFEEPSKIKEKFYAIFYYDIVSSYYMIEPIDKKEYNTRKKNNNLTPYNKEYKDNYLVIKTYNNETLSLYYYNDIISNIYNNPEYIYKKIDNSTKEKYFNTYKDFTNYIKNNNTFENTHLKKYEKTNHFYKLIDNKNNEYKINVVNGLNYSIKIKINDN